MADEDDGKRRAALASTWRRHPEQDDLVLSFTWKTDASSRPRRIRLDARLPRDPRTGQWHELASARDMHDLRGRVDAIAATRGVSAEISIDVTRQGPSQGPVTITVRPSDRPLPTT